MLQAATKALSCFIWSRVQVPLTQRRLTVNSCHTLSMMTTLQNFIDAETMSSALYPVILFEKSCGGHALNHSAPD